ncbi:hypothetical protein B0H14DRAFT_2583778 [Mycena olivaceomarginata]|nr:hypothetical protein B0H14DRAFT_2583778 [Mycena olivaceomarginata]
MAVLEDLKSPALPKKSPAHSKKPSSTKRTEKGHQLKVGHARLKVEPNIIYLSHTPTASPASRSLVQAHLPPTTPGPLSDQTFSLVPPSRLSVCSCVRLLMSNSPRKSFAQWKLERNTRQPPPQDNASTSAQPFPHSVDLLRNRNFLKPLGPFDGKVAAFAQLGAEHYFITTNTDYVPAVPLLETPHSVTDDPTLWPQQFTEHYCHLVVIAKKGTRPDLAAMWWDPSPQDFVVGSVVTRGLGRLVPAQMSSGDAKALEAKSSKTLLPLFGQLMAHTVMWLEQLQTLPTTFPKMLFVLTFLQREVLELDALYEYMTVYKPRMENYLVCSTSSENILNVVPLLELNLGLPDPDAHGEGAPPVLYTGNSTSEKIDAIHRATRYTLWYHDPFDTGLAHAPSPPLIASTSSHAVAPPLSNFDAAKHKKASAGPAKVDRDKFVALTVSEMPPLIDCMVTALARVDRDVIPYPVAGLAADTRYVLPEPALFANPDPQRRRQSLHHWKLLRDSFLFMLANRPQLLAPQQWRDVLEGHMTKRGLPDSRSYRRSKELEDVILEALEASNVKSRMLVGPPLEMSKQGWASTSLEERHVVVGRTATLMLDWVTKSHPPNIIRRIIDRPFWEHFGRAAVLPMRLDHDLEKEEGEL